MSKSQEHHKHNSASGVFLVMICWRLNFVYLFGAWSEALCNSFSDCESQEREEKLTFSCIECKSAWAFAVSILSAASHIQLLDPNFTALIYSWFGNSYCKWETIETLPESRGRGHWQWHACWAPVSVPAMVWSSVCLSAGEGDGDKPGSPSKSDPMDSASGGETLEERSSKEVMVLWWRSAAVKLRGIVELGQVSCSLGVSGQHMECACCYLSRLKI